MVVVQKYDLFAFCLKSPNRQARQPSSRVGDGWCAEATRHDRGATENFHGAQPETDLSKKGSAKKNQTIKSERTTSV
jgi:hypothetical protein